MSWLSSAVHDALENGRGLAVGKLGTCEVETLYLQSQKLPYNWVTRMQMTRNAGLWPDTNATLQSWAIHMEKHVLPKMDAVCTWWNLGKEETVYRSYSPCAHVEKDLSWLNPWSDPWTLQIPSCVKVAVVSPFVESIQSQTAKGHLNQLFPTKIWRDAVPEIIPIKTGCSPAHDAASEAAWSVEIQSGGWKIAVVHIVKQVIASGARVALVGCGALSLPIVTALKSHNIVGIHTGGSTQVIFGVRGARWLTDGEIAPLMKSPLWTNPWKSETPTHALTIEGGCYWMPTSVETEENHNN